MPIVTLYRHALETLTKTILTEFGPQIGVCPKCVLRRSHNLKKQLPDLKAVAAHSGATLSKETEDLVTHWDKDDPQGMKARYPVTMDGTPETLLNGDSFELKAFVEDHESALDELTDLLADLDYEQHQKFLKSEGISN
jgi:hypothetical protein